MIPLQSKLENEVFAFNELEDKLKQLGYTIGGNWDYDHGYFDYKLDDEVGYTFVRVPFTAYEKEIGDQGAMVTLGEPFLLAHKYQIGLDDNVSVGNLSGSLNQFSEPQDPDASIDDKWIGIGKKLIEKTESQLLAD
ncbi:YugN-like family protein [Fictibacillus sp. WQ 8-8]|uniref:YugN-like family protein n=1 Tax=Fictibacillus marinisediminis TaxID=2878389 RepID=A0A9X1XEB8_9BACL|nr:MULTISPECIES: YugN-like family protein [Fictibacillus]MCK6258275.1 YugN-like family protein [Fictibacillus marinisediminis]MCQ6268048.1 YugN-like family protein [Fictibacillus sp. WQ 8-8]MED2971279.1 YugN-like family protein [Fictibacillus sp. B-59209]